jgi:hypothetical protein
MAASAASILNQIPNKQQNRKQLGERAFKERILPRKITDLCIVYFVVEL